MRICITVKPGKKKESVFMLEDGTWVVSVSARAVDGKANEAVCLALSKYFKVAPSCVTIEKGKKGRTKTVCIF